MAVILKRAILTERSVRATPAGVYTFEVDPAATKGEIGAAVERLFKVKVVRVRTAMLEGKTKRVGRLKREITGSRRKKASVRLAPGQTIALFQTEGEGKV